MDKKAYIAGSVWYEPLEVFSVDLEWAFEQSHSLRQGMVESISDSLKKLGLQEFFAFHGTDGLLRNGDRNVIYAVVFLMLKEEVLKEKKVSVSSLLEKVKEIKEISFVLQSEDSDWNKIVDHVLFL